MRIAVLGAGFGGLELTTRLSDEFGDDVDIVLVDQSDGFVFGFSKLEVMFGRALPAAVHHPYRDLVKPGVEFVRATAEGQAAVVADGIRALIRGTDDATTYDGRGMCYLEFGRNEVGRVDVTFLSGQMPRGALEGPSPELAADKVEFGATRIRRWFGRTWPAVG